MIQQNQESNTIMLDKVSDTENFNAYVHTCSTSHSVIQTAAPLLRYNNNEAQKPKTYCSQSLIEEVVIRPHKWQVVSEQPHELASKYHKVLHCLLPATGICL